MSQKVIMRFKLPDSLKAKVKDANQNVSAFIEDTLVLYNGGMLEIDTGPAEENKATSANVNLDTLARFKDKVATTGLSADETIRRLLAKRLQT